MDKIRFGGKEFSPDVFQDMIDAGIFAGAKHDTSSSTPNATPTHGQFPGNNNQYGIFSDAGVRPGMWNATARVRSIGQYIPMYKSTIWNELIDVATGVTAGSGNNQTSACAVGPKPGQLKKMKISATFGIIHMSTKIFDITQAGSRRNRADVDRQFFNQAGVNNPWLPQIPGIDGSGVVNDALRAEALALGIELERNVSKVHFLGVSGTEDNTYAGVARQWNGLDRLIRTGWTDADTGQAAAAADAAVVNFNADVNGGTDANGRSFTQALIDTHFGQIDYLGRISVNPFFALAMRPDLFRYIAQNWSCAYATTRCLSTQAGTPVVRDAEAIRRLYEDMLRNQYIPMEGMDVPVVLDDSIARDVRGNGQYKSPIYGVALRGNGLPTLYGEYFDMANAEAESLAGLFGTAATGETTTINNGMYRVFKRVTGGCYEFDFFARPRLITDAPFMHFKLDNVWYTSYYNQHDAIPGQSFYANGGRTYLT